MDGTCAKCDGHGTIDAFRNIHNGLCFSCSGTGKVKVYPKSRAQSIDSQFVLKEFDGDIWTFCGKNGGAWVIQSEIGRIHFTVNDGRVVVKHYSDGVRYNGDIRAIKEDIQRAVDAKRR